MIPRNATQFCKLVEARLGWVTRVKHGYDFQVYGSEAKRVNAKREENPDLYSWRNLAATVELLAREKKARTPLGVFAHVQRALDLAMDDDTDLEKQIAEVVAHETHLGDPAGWVTRFARATGAEYRLRALHEWREATRC